MLAQDQITMFVIDRAVGLAQRAEMLGHDEIMAELIRQLDAGMISGAEVAAKLVIAPARAVDDAMGAVDNATAAMFDGDLSDPAIIAALPESTRAAALAFCTTPAVSTDRATCERLGLVGAAFTAMIEQRFADRADVAAMIARCRADYTTNGATDYAQVGGCVRLGRGVAR